MALYLDHFAHCVHDAKVNDELGVGMTKCGRTFLVGIYGFIHDSDLGKAAEQMPADVEGEAAEKKRPWTQCEKCKVESFKLHQGRWRRWKCDMKATLKKLGFIEAAEEVEAESVS